MQKRRAGRLLAVHIFGKGEKSRMKKIHRSILALVLTFTMLLRHMHQRICSYGEQCIGNGRTRHRHDQQWRP